MLKEFLSRVGTFLILIGIGILILFVASDSLGAASFDYLFWALLAIIGGIFLRRRRESSPPGERFSLLRKLRGADRDHRERK